MVEDQFFDLEGTQGFMWMKGWRCMNCGHAEDPLIATNHRLHQATVLVQLSEEPGNENGQRYPWATTVPRVTA
jgi:hypothetical protein